MELSQAADIFVKLAVDITPAQMNEFRQAISNANPTDPGLVENALTLERWKTENQTNPEVMILSSRITNIRINAEALANKSKLPEPDYNSILNHIQTIINEMDVVFNQQLRWPEQTTPIVKAMNDDAKYIFSFAKIAAAAAAEKPAETAPVAEPTI